MRQGLLLVMIAYASVGLVLSLGAHVASFFTTPPGGYALFVGLHVGIFPLWLPVVFIANAMNGGGFGGSRRMGWESWNAILATAPGWMRMMTFGFFAYAIVNFAAFFVLTTTGHGVGKSLDGPPGSVWHGFSGHWMAFYSAGLAIATAAYLRGPGPLAKTCPNGHAVSIVDNFCPRCGLPVAKGGKRSS
jgi:hypothetical protein